jgi:hypothetical protein
VSLSCSYTPPGAFSGTDSFAYTLCAPAPNASLCDTATVTVSALGAGNTVQSIPVGPWWLIALAVALGATRSLRQVRRSP